jgi:hypothetical protein
VILAVEFQGGIENAWSGPDYASAYDTTLGPDSSVSEEFGTSRNRPRGR